MPAIEFLQHFEDFAFSRALEVAWSIVARVDKMISEAKPWDLAKDVNQQQTLNAVLYRAAETLRWLCVLLYPVMPVAAQEIHDQLGLKGSVASIDPSQLKWGELAVGTQIAEVKPLFPRMDKGKIMSEINNTTSQDSASEAGPQTRTSSSRDRAGVHITEAEAVSGASQKSETTPTPPVRGATEADAVSKPEGVATFIEIGDFAKVEMRVGQVLSAERIPKADKLLLLKIDIGEEQPTSSSRGNRAVLRTRRAHREESRSRGQSETSQASRLRVAGNGSSRFDRRRRPAGYCNLH